MTIQEQHGGIAMASSTGSVMVFCGTGSLLLVGGPGGMADVIPPRLDLRGSKPSKQTTGKVMAKTPKKKPRAPGKLVRLKVNRFRTVVPGTELHFSDGINVILGKNGTGKTTLLDLISRVLRSDFSDLKNEAFDLEYDYTHENGRASFRLANEDSPTKSPNRTVRKIKGHKVAQVPSEQRFTPHASVEVTLERITPTKFLTIEIDRGTMTWRLGRVRGKNTDDHDLFAPGFGAQLTGVFLFKAEPKWEYVETASILRDFYMKGSKAYRFDEALHVFRGLTDHSASGRPPRPGPFTQTTLIHLKPPAESPFESLENPAALFVPLVSLINGKNPSSLGPLKLNLRPHNSLSRFTELTGFSELEVTWDVIGSRPIGDEMWWEYGSLSFHCATKDGVRLRHDALSYGQKRLLTYLYYIANNSHFVVADELVNGMHHDWIRACVDMIGHRQAFLTSQNPLLLDYLSFDTAEALGQSFIQCRTVEQGSRSRFQWGNLGSEESTALFEELKVGIQYLNELLRARGLW
jgi:hypothetical protein